MSKKNPSLWQRALEAAVGDDTPGSAPLANRLLAKLPGGAIVQEQMDKVEKRILGELKSRLDRLEGSGEQTVQVVAFSMETQSGHAPTRDLREPAEMLRELLAISSEQSKEQAELAYYSSLLRNLLPDEARILSAVSDGGVYPLINLVALSKLGIQSHVVLENTCSVGRAAGVQLPEMTRGYIQRLMAAGLVETGPEDYALTTKYEILETDDVLRKLIAQMKVSGQRNQLKRRVLKISELGRNLWEACRITED
ncbi:Abi-alpha family protein [Nevskia sp.]|uniref:Abi-alpha family protein n=1 Tax=Nevskia sp. TaxID=1929292 RepID=UPI0025DF3DEC|nr:Abi-alpha family protein [Nevskia sp.]